MSHVVHLVPTTLDGLRWKSSACGFTVFATETHRIAKTLDEVTCESCRRTRAYREARKAN